MKTAGENQRAGVSLKQKESYPWAKRPWESPERTVGEKELLITKKKTDAAKKGQYEPCSASTKTNRKRTGSR